MKTEILKNEIMKIIRNCGEGGPSEDDIIAQGRNYGDWENGVDTTCKAIKERIEGLFNFVEQHPFWESTSYELHKAFHFNPELVEQVKHITIIPGCPMPVGIEAVAEFVKLLEGKQTQEPNTARVIWVVDECNIFTSEQVAQLKSKGERQ